MRETRVVDGEAALSALEELDPILVDFGVPITARAPWLRCYAQAYPTVRPVLITVEEDGSVIGAACLGRVDGLIVEWTALGHPVSDYSVFPAVDDDAVRRLAEAIAAQVREGTRPWRLRLEQFVEDDPVQRSLLLIMKNVHVRRGIPAIRLRLTEPRDLNRHLSKNTRRARTKGMNRLERAGHVVTVVRSREADVVRKLVDQAVAVRQERDHEVRGYCDHDDPRFRRFYRELMPMLAARGELELNALLVGDTLIGYLFLFVDGSTFRIWDARVHSEWVDYSTGRICCVDAIESALADSRITMFDWMRGDQEYKRSAMDHIVDHQHLHAWSSSPVRRGLRVAAGVERRVLRARRRLRRRTSADER